MVKSILKRFLWAFFFFTCISEFTFGQGFVAFSDKEIVKSETSSSDFLDVSALLRSQNYYSNISQKIYELKKSKSISASQENALGHERTFFVRNIYTLSHWDTLTAECIYTSNNLALWLHNESLDIINNNSIDIQQLVDSLSYSIELRTNSNSVEPDLGILDLNTKYFGQMPDVDGDGVLDVLLLDIQDNYENTGSFVAGFFDPVDLIDHPNSNKSDLLYIDIYPSLFIDGKATFSRILATIAHELQHLIHANYEGDTPQSIFINEGLSEFAEILAGYYTRNHADYFQSSNRELLSWNYDDSIPDYTRASLFTTYLFEQLGFDRVKELVQSREVGLTAYTNLVEKYSSISFDDLFSDWGNALLINDAALNSKFGYKHKFLSSFDVMPITENQLPIGINVPLRPYSNRYLLFPFANEIQIESFNEEKQYFGIGVYPKGRTELLPSKDGQLLATEFRHSSLIINLSQLDELNSESYLINGKKDSQVNTLVFDDGIPDQFSGQASYLLLNDHTSSIALNFPITEESWISGFYIKSIFLNEVSGSGVPGNSERDLLYQIYTVENGKPSQPITTQKSHSFSRAFGNLKFEYISLSHFYDNLSSITDTISVVIQNDNDDENYFAVALEDASKELGVYRKNSQWSSFDDRIIDGVNLEGWIPFLRLEIVSEQEYIPQDRTNFDIQVNNSFVEMKSKFDYPLVLSESNVVAQLPSGRVYNSSFRVNESGGYLAEFPIEVDGEYKFRLTLKNEIDNLVYSSSFDWQIPETEGFSLGNNYPNPFNPLTTIPFLLLEEGNVSAQVFDVLGRHVFSQSRKNYPSGNNLLKLDFSGYASGTYIVKMMVERPGGRGVTTEYLKVMLLK